MARVVCVESGLRHASTLPVRILCNGGLNKTVVCRTEPMLHIAICLGGVLGAAKKPFFYQRHCSIGNRGVSFHEAWTNPGIAASRSLCIFHIL